MASGLHIFAIPIHLSDPSDSAKHSDMENRIISMKGAVSITPVQGCLILGDHWAC